MEINKRLENLRKLMIEEGIEAYIVNTADPHQSEYIADHYKTRQWISGFTGSAGTVVVTEKDAILWTDGRYFIQGEEELKGSEFQLYKMRTEGFPTYGEWLRDNLKRGDTIGFDGELLSQSAFEELEGKLENKEIGFNGDLDLVGEIWTDREDLPKKETFIHEIEYTGKTTKEKIHELREKMKKREVDSYLIGSLDDIAWLFNIRGGDVEFNPVILSYAYISMEEAILFVDRDKIGEKVKHFLEENTVSIQAYEDVKHYISEIDEKNKIYVDKSRINSSLYKSIPKACKIVEGTDLTSILKARKNPTEIKNQKNAYIKDGVALVKYFYWLDKNLAKIEINEYTAQKRLLEFRKEQDHFIEESFASISAYRENAAMMHYSAQEDQALELKEEGMYLIDSGGQYLDGTTDITRTLILGEISEEERRDYSLTLKAQINLASARFLYGSTGHSLDVLSRYPLWQEGLDYKCGTGHGVGYLLNVHEGPHSIAMRANEVVLEEGMVVTIEPGVYKTGSHGIRIENVFVIQKDIATDSGQFMNFQCLSFVPIDLRGLDIEILSQKEIKWLNDYHQEVFQALSPHLDEDEKEWLREETREI